MRPVSVGEGGVVVFGEVLADRFPDGGEVLGGAPFNVAWNLQGLGAAPVLVSRIGDDALGSRILEAMTEWGLETGCVQVDSRRPTGVVRVTFEEDEPAFDIVPDSAWDFIAAEAAPRAAGALLYHGSLASRSPSSRTALQALIDDRPETVFFDVNLRPPWWETARLGRLLATADEVKLNQAELEELAPAGDTLDEQAGRLLESSGAARLHVTRGARGAATFAAAGGEPIRVGPGRVGRPRDTVGAGDAFSAVLILGGLRSWPLDVTLGRARDFAAAVVGLRGATTTDPLFYEQFTINWRDS